MRHTVKNRHNHPRGPSRSLTGFLCVELHAVSLDQLSRT